MAARNDGLDCTLDCALDRDGDAMVVALTGTVDYTTIPTMRAALGTAFTEPGSPTVIVDLTGVEFLGSAGIAALVDAARAQHDDTVAALRIVVDDTRPVIRPIQLTGLDGVLALYRSREDALGDADR
ncbi:STAS domain-containing protein [Pseudonocardia yuanmonensis]|uniref:Anti-sigma factor antagonist n=1 Tax=Pseudonocardia yuanmonensis TaxID=1095914 RepID=A0ABP8WN29_9PSEU